MSTRFGLVTAAALLAVASGFAARAAGELGYDPAADPFAQLESAKREATAASKHILIVAGGDWCSWCHYLQAFLDRNDEINRALEDTFVVVHVNYGTENKNEKFFGTLPEAPGYPHFWILGADGSLLRSQGTSPLEDGERSYDKPRFMAFIDEWAATLGR